MLSTLSFSITFNNKNQRMLFMFEKHCQICRIEVDKKTASKRFGKYFCSDDHTQQYLKKREEQKREEQKRAMAEEEKRHPRKRGGCC